LQLSGRTRHVEQKYDEWSAGQDGINWAAIDNNNGINFSDNADFIPPLVLDMKNSQNYILAATGCIRRPMRAGVGRRLLAT
jgi:hypothetical protein